MSEPTIPAPGSDEASRSGCTCPIFDNARGAGYLGQPGIYVVQCGCPLHDLAFRPTTQEPDHG